MPISKRTLAFPAALFACLAAFSTTSAEAQSTACSNDTDAQSYRFAYDTMASMTKSAWDSNVYGCNGLEKFIGTYFIRHDVAATAPSPVRCSSLGMNDAMFASVPPIVQTCATTCAEVGIDRGNQYARKFCQVRSIQNFVALPVCQYIRREACAAAFANVVLSNESCKGRFDSADYQKALSEACFDFQGPTAPGGTATPTPPAPVKGFCKHIWNPNDSGPRPVTLDTNNAGCVKNEDCKDGNSATHDVCGRDVGRCKHVSNSTRAVVYDGKSCDDDTECKEGNSDTADYCER